MGSCQLEILSSTVGTTYDYPELEEKLAKATPDVLLTASDADVSWAGADPAPAARIELRLSAEASTRLGDAIEAASNNAFAFSCNGERLFVGVGYLWYGAAALKTPVLHVERSATGLVILRLGAWQGAWTGLSAADAAAKHRLDQITFRAVLCRRGLLHELDPEARPSTP
jgi:hypothetical protein